MSEKWIPFEIKKLSPEQKQKYPEYDYGLYSSVTLPRHYEDIFVSDGKKVWIDKFIISRVCSLASGLDIEGLAWMKIQQPQPWNKTSK